MYSQSPSTCIAYFSMEFMLSEALPIYSGGLGNVAGDQLKA
jgi:starch phosphorylase